MRTENEISRAKMTKKYFPTIENSISSPSHSFGSRFTGRQRGRPTRFACIVLSGAHYKGAGGIHGTLITGSAHNTIVDYDTVPEYKWKMLQVIRVLCLAHQCHAQSMKI